MKKIRPVMALLMALTFLIGCSNTQEVTGSLTVESNGEAFIEEGFISKDGWHLSFDHVNVGISNIKIFQLDQAYQAHDQEIISENPLAHDHDMIVSDFKSLNQITSFDALPSGHYNALSWTIAPSNDTPAIEVIGTARKGHIEFPFHLNFDTSMVYYGGEYIGDTRKGFVTEDKAGTLEITLHIDHLFGDGDSQPTDSINTGALGFEPFYKLSTLDKVLFTQEDIDTVLTAKEADQLKKIMLGLFHVGEGHTYSERL